MMRIELVHFRGCPHVESARENLRRALEQFGEQLRWREVDIDSATAPSHARGLPSPTILVDGKDVSSTDGPGAGRACRLGGAPTAEMILRALREGP